MRSEKFFVVFVAIVILLIVGTVFFLLFYPSIIGNKTLIDTKWEYNQAYITFGTNTIKVDIDSWSEDDSTFTIICKDGKVYCTDQINVVMVKE